MMTEQEPIAEAAEAAPFPPIGGPLDDVNATFHDAYDQERGSSALEGPVFVVMADTLVVVRDGEETSHTITPRAVQVLKSVAHAPLAAFHVLGGGATTAQSTAAKGDVAKLRARLVACARSLPDEGLDEAERTIASDVLSAPVIGPRSTSKGPRRKTATTSKLNG